MKPFGWIRIALLGALMTGCMTGPDYEKPDLNVPDQWSQPLEGGETAASPERVHWWTAFTDPTLESLVARALESNLDLQTAESRILEARASLLMTGAALWPQVNSSASYQRKQSVETPASGGPSGRGSAVFSQNGLQGVSVTGSAPGGPSITLSPDLSGQGNTTVSVSMGTEGAGKPPSRYSNLYQAGFDASWELDLFGGVRRATEAARAEIEAAEESRRSVLIMIAAEVARTYFDLRAFQNRLEISRQQSRTLEESLALVTARFQAGLTNELDVKRAEAQLATTRSTLPAMEYYVEQAIHRLGILSGREPGALRQELADAAPLPPAPPEVLVGLPSELLSRRPDVRFAERELAAATARIGVATADLFPRFSLTGSFSGADDTLAGLRLGANHLWSIGPAVQWPVFDAGRIRANIRIQNARQEQALLAYEKAVLYSLEDVENALVRYAKEQNRLVELTAAVQASQKALDIADDLYKQGLVNFLNVLDAQRTLFAAQDQRVQSQANVLTSLVALYKALGGGWETPLELGEPAADTTTSAEQDSQHGLS